MTAEFTVLAKFYESPTHGSVLEVVVAGPNRLEKAESLRITIKEATAEHQPQCLVINLLEFVLPFNGAVLGALVEGCAAITKMGGRYALVARGYTASKLEELLRSTKLESVLGPVFPDVETALAGARVLTARHTEPRPAPPSEPGPRTPAATPAAPVNPGIWFPDLRTASSHRFTEFAGLFMFTCLVVALAARPLSWPWAIPGGMLLLYYGAEGFRVGRNMVRRSRWARSFTGKVTASQAAAMLKDPGRFFECSHSYGGLGTTKLKPATLIVDRLTGALWAVD